MTRTLEQRLDRVVVDVNGCWVWQGARLRTRKPYGVIWLDGKVQKVHRVVWMLHFGPIPATTCVLHSCDNPPCCNPEHLFLGTHQDNSRDMVRKGRLRGGPGGMHNPGSPTRAASPTRERGMGMT